MGLNNGEAGQLFALRSTGCLLACNTRGAIPERDPPLAGEFQPLSARCSEVTVRGSVGSSAEHVFVMDCSSNLVKGGMSCHELCSVIP